jgi:glutathione S-transferase
MEIRFYYSAGSNCCERVRWALDFKRAQYELVDLAEPFDAQHFARISPFGRVPVMEVAGTPLTESMAMVELIEELVPAPPLTYADALGRAQVREVCEAVNSSIHPVQNSSVIRYLWPGLAKEEIRPIRAEWIASNLAKLAPRLWQASAFAVGDRFTLADIFVGAIYRKGIELGMAPSALSQLEDHWLFLLSHPAIRDSCPIAGRAPQV